MKRKKKKEKEKDEVKGIAIIDGIYYEATSPDMLLLPFLSVTNDTMTTLPSRYAQYIEQKLLPRKNLLISALNLDKGDGKDPNHPIPDPREQILSNADKLNVLAKLRKSLKTFYKRLLNAEKQGDQEQILKFQDLDVFNHVLETMATDSLYS